jgi:hypothetical protein
MNIIKTDLKFKQLIPRTETKYLILHHRAGDGDLESIHQEHIKQGWAGIGYQFYVRKNGNTYQGRPINMIGAHCPNHNSVSIGICAEGNYDREKIMPLVQFESIIQVIKLCKNQYKGVIIKGHRELFATACPGKYFPLDKLK